MDHFKCKSQKRTIPSLNWVTSSVQVRCHPKQKIKTCIVQIGTISTMILRITRKFVNSILRADINARHECDMHVQFIFLKTKHFGRNYIFAHGYDFLAPPQSYLLLHYFSEKTLPTNWRLEELLKTKHEPVFYIKCLQSRVQKLVRLSY